MSEIRKITADIQSIFADSSYPQDFLDAYDQMECLANHTGRETFLVRRKSDGLQAIAKCYDRSVFPFMPDVELLKSLHEPELPAFIEQFRNEKMLCVVREYVEGVPLDRYVMDKRPDLPEILSISDKLCGILDSLHSQTPAVIHRDIKPENIIVRSDGMISLIDFDIARTIRDNAEKDTISFGTKGYAPPEQYGFSQTDQKADIYAFGVLLRWLVTGSVQANPNISMDPVLQQVIDKCTAFSPEERYNSIHQVRAALRNVGKRSVKPDAKALACIAAVVVLFLGLGFVLGRFTGIFRRETPPAAVIFDEPLIEKSVRLQLGVEESTVLTTEMLQNVRQLFIYGSEAYAEQDEFFMQDRAFHQQGPIRSLNDLEKLPNLERLFMVFQGQVDISALGRLKNLEYIELKHMQLYDVSPLSEVLSLHGAVLFDTGVSDVTALEACHWLDTLDVGHNPIHDMEHIGSFLYLQTLSLRGLEMLNLSGIEKMPSLKGLTLAQTKIDDLSALREVSWLEKVYVTPDLETAVSDAVEGTGIEVVIIEN